MVVLLKPECTPTNHTYCGGGLSTIKLSIVIFQQTSTGPVERFSTVEELFKKKKKTDHPSRPILEPGCGKLGGGERVDVSSTNPDQQYNNVGLQFGNFPPLLILLDSSTDLHYVRAPPWTERGNVEVRFVSHKDGEPQGTSAYFEYKHDQQNTISSGNMEIESTGVDAYQPQTIPDHTQISDVVVSRNNQPQPADGKCF